MQVAYRCRAGGEATWVYRWLIDYDMNPKWEFEGAYTFILLDSRDMACLRLLQKSIPSRFGNAPDATGKRLGVN